MFNAFGNFSMKKTAAALVAGEFACAPQTATKTTKTTTKKTT